MLKLSEPYREGQKTQEFMLYVIEKKLSDEIAKLVQTKLAASIVLALKKDKYFRFCVEYRKLKTATEQDDYSMPQVHDCVNLLRDDAVFSALGANSAWWHVEIEIFLGDKTTFTSHQRLYSFGRMSFGIRNALSTCVILFFSSRPIYIEKMLFF